MYRRILLCYDASTEGRNALREGAEIAMCMHADAILLAICRSGIEGSIPEAVTPTLFQCDEDRARAILDEGVAWLAERGLTARGVLVYGDPLTSIPDVARDVGADLIVVAHRPRGRLARWWSDSDEETLLDRVRCSILAAVASAPT